jgi:hypothetical protein
VCLACAMESLHYYEIIDNVTTLVSLQSALNVCGSTYEKMTFLGSRFFEKGRRSGSWFAVHLSISLYHIQALRELPMYPLTRLRCLGGMYSGW